MNKLQEKVVGTWDKQQKKFGIIFGKLDAFSGKFIHKNKFFKKYAFILYQYKILSKFKKKLDSVGTSLMDWFYKEK